MFCFKIGLKATTLKILKSYKTNFKWKKYFHLRFKYRSFFSINVITKIVFHGLCFTSSFIVGFFLFYFLFLFFISPLPLDWFLVKIVVLLCFISRVFLVLKMSLERLQNVIEEILLFTRIGTSLKEFKTDIRDFGSYIKNFGTNIKDFLNKNYFFFYLFCCISTSFTYFYYFFFCLEILAILQFMPLFYLF